MKDHVIVAHRADPDGIISHALLRRAFGENNIRRHYFVDYDDFLSSLRTINEKNSNAEIIVADISLNDSYLDEALFMDLKKKNRSLTWIDHHDKTAINKPFLEQFCNEITYAPHQCAAELVRERYNFCLHPDYDSMLAGVAHAHDFEQRKTLPWQVGNSLQQIIASGYDLEKLVHDLATGKAWQEAWIENPVFNINYKHIAADFLIKKEDAYRRLRENAESFEIAGKKVVFAFADPMLYMKDAPEYLKLHYDVDYVVAAFDGISNIIFFGKGNIGKSALDFCMAMGGGGRGHGGGFDIGHTVNKKNYSEDKEYLMKRLEEFLRNYNTLK